MAIGIRIMKKSGKTATCLICSKYNKKSRFVAGEQKEEDMSKWPGWIEKVEPVLTPTGRLKLRGGWVHNHYCRKCSKSRTK